MEFRVTTDLTPVSNMEIEGNFREAYNAIREMMAPFEKMAVTPETIAEAKRDRAKIRSMEKQISDYRIQIKKTFLKPIDDFEVKCRALSDICARAAGNLDRQVKGFEEEKRQEKIARLQAFYEETAADILEYFPFDAIREKRWENVSVSEEAAKREMDETAEKLRAGLTAIRIMESPHESELITAYMETRRLAEVMQKKARLEETDRRERERRERQAAAQAAEATPGTAEHPAMEAAPRTPGLEAPEMETDGPEDGEAEKIELIFRVRVTERQMRGLKQYMKDHGIKPERI